MASPVVSRHYEYMANFANWQKYRLTFDGGWPFIDNYMIKLSVRESDASFLDRKNIAFCPNFGQAAVKEITNSIFQRIADVERRGGSDSYQSCVNGENGGVDYEQSSMGTFIGMNIIDELLSMSKVGVLIDNHSELGTTKADLGDKHPYLATYRTEDILNWHKTDPKLGFDVILLREYVEKLDELGLPDGYEERYRYMRRTDNGVTVIFFDTNGNPGETFELKIKKIPFVVFEIKHSMLKDVSDYQRTLLNMESSDVAFTLKANYPFYYEFYDERLEPTALKGPATPNSTGTEAESGSAKKEIAVGNVQGRRIKKGLDAPGFINPNPETLLASMQKIKQIKEDIRSAINLNLTSLNPRRQSAESKNEDGKSLEASLSFIALVLQRGEQEIAEVWTQFDGSSASTKITYPKTYSLKTDEDRRNEAKALDELADKVPSKTFRRYIKKKIAKVLVGSELLDEELNKIDQEIESAEVLSSDPNIIISAHKEGLVDDVTASEAIGFDGEKVVPQARKDRAERIKLTMEAQGGPENASGARGAPEFDKGQATSSDEKEGKAGRGKADNTNKGVKK